MSFLSVSVAVKGQVAARAPLLRVLLPAVLRITRNELL